MTGTEVRELHGEAALEAVTVTDNWTGTRRTIDARALFVFIGMAPCTCWLGELVDLDDRGFVRTGGTERSLLETSRPGIFAVGDVRAGSAKRVATAVGEGAMAIRLAFERTGPA
jgi:thioredoxin reductase (NADPH)